MSEKILGYTSNTEILTENRGFVKFRNLRGWEKIATLNHDSKNIEYVKPIGYDKITYDGEIIQLKNQWFNISATDNTSLLLHTRERTNRTGSITPSRFKFRKISNLLSNDRIYRSSKWIGHSPTIININGLEIDTMTFCRLMGYYLSEGSITYSREKRNPTYYNIRISQNYGRKYEKISDDLKSLPMLKHNKGHLSLNDERLGKYLKSFGHAYKKYIPTEIKQLHPFYIRVFLDAFLLGDGTIKKADNKKGMLNGSFQDQKIHYTSSKQLRDGLMELVLKIQKTPSCMIHAKKGTKMMIKEREFFSRRNTFTIHEGTTIHTKMEKVKNTRKHYKGFLYNVELPHNHSIYLKSHGQTCWSASKVEDFYNE